jgi:hypothetical protein
MGISRYTAKKSIPFIIVGMSAIFLGVALFLDADFDSNFFYILLIIVGIVDLLCGIYALRFAHSHKKNN